MKLKIYYILSTLAILLSGCSNSFLPSNESGEMSSIFNSTSMSNEECSNDINTSEQNESDKQYEYLKFEMHEDGYYIVAGFAKEKKEEVIIPNYYKGLPVKTIKKDAFFANTAVKKVTFGDNIIDIGASAFYHTGIEEISIPENVKKINQYTFGDCKNLKIVNFHKNITEIKSNAFSSCTSLKTIEFPENLTTLGSAVFSNCTLLESVVINDKLIDLTGNTFFGCSSLKEIAFGKNVKSIGWKTFESCTSLVEIEIPEHVLYVDRHAFNSCTSLEKVNFLSNELSEYIFYNCTSLTSITFSTNFQIISKCSFEKCTSLKEIVIPKSTIYIGEDSFKGCTSLTKIYYEGTEEQWNNIDIHEVNEDLLSKEIIFNYSK